MTTSKNHITHIHLQTLLPPPKISSNSSILSKPFKTWLQEKNFLDSFSETSRIEETPPIEFQDQKSKWLGDKVSRDGEPLSRK